MCSRWEKRPSMPNSSTCRAIRIGCLRLWLVAAMCCSTSGVLAAAINGPRQDNSANLSLAVRQVDVKADGTTVSFRYYSKKGYWFRIAKDAYLTANGNKYRVTAADGITLGENNYPQVKASTAIEGTMGDMYYSDFTLTFEPFKAVPETFDFKEGDGKGAFVIRNISLK